MAPVADLAVSGASICRVWVLIASVLTVVCGCCGATAQPEPEAEDRAERQLKKLGVVCKHGSEAPDKSIVEIFVPGNDVEMSAADYAGLRAFKRLKKVVFSGCFITDEFLEHLADLRLIEEMELRACSVSDEGLRWLKDLDKLRHLSITVGRSVTDRGIRYIAKMKNLEKLELMDTQVTGKTLGQLTGLKKLKSLDLRLSQVSDEGLESVAQLKSLEWLGCWQNYDITDKGLEHLSKLPNIKSIVLYGTEVSDSAVAEFERKKPGVQVSNK
jgi:hypothetical protein